MTSHQKTERIHCPVRHMRSVCFSLHDGWWWFLTVHAGRPDQTLHMSHWNGVTRYAADNLTCFFFSNTHTRAHFPVTVRIRIHWIRLYTVLTRAIFGNRLTWPSSLWVLYCRNKKEDHEYCAVCKVLLYGWVQSFFCTTANAQWKQTVIQSNGWAVGIQTAASSQTLDSTGKL